MWDPRFPELAAARLAERQMLAHVQTQIAAGPGPLRRHLGAALVRLGERLAAPASPAAARPATVAR